MDNLYSASHFVLAGLLGLGIFVLILAKANESPSFLRTTYWAWVVGAVIWAALSYFALPLVSFDFLWAKVVVAIGALIGVLFGGVVAVFVRANCEMANAPFLRTTSGSR